MRDFEAKPIELKNGVTISGAMHLAVLLVMLFGTDFLSARESAPLNVTEIDLIDGTKFDAAVSAAPNVSPEVPEELKPETSQDQAVLDLSVPDVAIQVPDMPVLAPEAQPSDAAPEFSALLIPPPPTSIVTEPPRASIARIPSPDEVLRQAPTPESAPATEPLRALAAAPKPEAAPRPLAPPEPEPVAAPTPEPEPEAAEKPEPEPEPEVAVESPEPERTPEPDPGETAPLGPAPQEARLPVAKPAKLAAAAPAASKPEQKAVTPEKTEEPEPEKTAEPKPAQPAASNSSQFASIVTPGEKDALRLGIKRYFVYNGNRSDPSLRVTIRIRLAEDASIIGKPEQISASGGTEGTQDVLFRSGRIALLRAAAAGEFKKLPPEKYDGWKLIHVTFTPEEIGFSS